MKLYLTTILALFIFISVSCLGQKEQVSYKIKSESEIEKRDKTLTNAMRIVVLRDSMLEYMETAHPTYSKDDVEECVKILNNYLTAIKKTDSKEEGMSVVKNTIEKLNQLNNKCKLQLVDTMEREQIADIIISASSEKGYNTSDDDITEDWREW